MLVKIEINGKWAERVGAKDKRVIEFCPGVNLLVGPNGSGKSSVISAIKMNTSARTEHEKKQAREDVPVTTSGPIGLMILDFEKDNPRTKNYLSDGAGLGFQLGSMWRSHGETTRVIVDNLDSDELKGKLVILDEPDQALDFDGAKLLLKKLEASPAAQMIVSVHHPVLVLSGLLSGFNIIELEEGYKERMREGMKKMVYFVRD